MISTVLQAGHRWPLRSRLLLLAFVGLAMLAVADLTADDATSARFRLSQATTNSGGGSSTSSSFVLDGSVSQPATVGDSASASFLLQSGFWTSLSVESILRVEGAGSGRGTVTGPDVDCILDAGAASGTCLAKFVDGTTLGLVAVPDAANQFDGWTGCQSTATTTRPGDTCQVTLSNSRTVTAAFTRLATAGGRVWRDVDGDGVPDPSEPGLDGVTVTLSDGDAISRDLTSSGGGLYTFADVPPGTYTVGVDTASLPAGVVASYDLDGIATPHETEVTLTDGEIRTDVEFGYQPLVDLTITQSDSEDPLPGGQNLVYTITVQNLGPGIATGVQVSDDLPVGTTLVATQGCAEDPTAAPVCSLGDLPVGAMASYTLEVEIDPAPPGSITNMARTTAIEVDIDFSNNTTNETTELDDGSPQVRRVDTAPPTFDGLTECETVNRVDVSRLVVEFSEPMLDPAGDSTLGDVTNPRSWRLIEAGADLVFSTMDCLVMAGDDRAIDLASVIYEPGSRVATFTPADGPIHDGLYRLLACGSGSSALTDLAGNPLDGDGDGFAGGDFVRQFRADPDNILANGLFDCDLARWELLHGNPVQIAYSSDDLDSSAESGSVRIESLEGDAELRQCLDVAGVENSLDLSGYFRMTVDSVGVGVRLGCTFWDGLDCTGTPSSLESLTLLGDTGGEWIQLHHDIPIPPGSPSAHCGVKLVDVTGEGYVAEIDSLELRQDRPLFSDGFESGDLRFWSGSEP